LKRKILKTKEQIVHVTILLFIHVNHSTLKRQSQKFEGT
jgi:hypothetical protein